MRSQSSEWSLESTLSTATPSSSLSNGGRRTRRPRVPANPYQPLLTAAMPVQNTVEGRCTLLLRRAAPSQSFGLTFTAYEGPNGGLVSVRAAEDLPHLDIARGDAVVSVNGGEPTSLEECLVVMQESMALTLVLEKAHGARRALDPFGQGETVPLAVSAPVVTDPERGEFQMALRRCSLSQRFGITFSSEEMKVPGLKPRIVVAASVPHLGLLAGDVLLGINGCQPGSEFGCQAVLASCRTVSLSLQRPPAKLALAPKALPLLELQPEGPCPPPTNSPPTVQVKEEPPAGAGEQEYPWWCSEGCRRGISRKNSEAELDMVGVDVAGGEVKAYLPRQQPFRPRMGKLLCSL